MGFLAGLVLYGVGATRSPYEWTTPVWITLAFFVVPVLVGLVNGAVVKLPRNGAEGFRIGLRSGGWAMFLYASASMMWAHYRVGYNGNTGGVLLVGLVVAITYALIAGVVAGCVCALLIGRRTKSTEQNTE